MNIAAILVKNSPRLHPRPLARQRGGSCPDPLVVAEDPYFTHAALLKPKRNNSAAGISEFTNSAAGISEFTNSVLRISRIYKNPGFYKMLPSIAPATEIQFTNSVLGHFCQK